MVASKAGRVGVLEQLLDAGADPNQTDGVGRWLRLELSRVVCERDSACMKLNSSEAAFAYLRCYFGGFCIV